jgi:hypothetical protein
MNSRFFLSVRSLAIILIAAIFLSHVNQSFATEPAADRRSELGRLLEKQGYTAVPLLTNAREIAGRQKFYLVKLMVKDVLLLVILDTGADTYICLKDKPLRRIGITVKDIDPVKELARQVIESRLDVGSVAGFAIDGSSYVIKNTITVDFLSGLNHDETYTHPDTAGTHSVPIDGVLGMKFLQEHSAVIDCESGTMYLMPRAKRLLPLWGGRWECSGGEKDGKPITDAETRSLYVRDDLTVEINAIGQSWRGALHPTRYGKRDLFHVYMNDPDGQSYAGIEGIYRLEGDKLTLCVLDNSLRGAPVARVHKSLPTEFNAAEGSGYVVFHFQRKSVKLPAVPPKK